MTCRIHKSSWVLATLLAVTFDAQSKTFGEGTATLAPSSEQVVLSGVDPTYGIVKWIHGAFVYRTRGNTAPDLVVLSPQGIPTVSFTPSIPDSTHVFANDFDRASDGSIVFSGSSYSAEGQHVPFICWISADGKSSRVVRTAPYFPYGLSIAPDGSVWTSGFEMINGKTDAPGTDPTAGVIRHFTSSGTPIESLGSLKNFRADRLTHGFLVANEDRIGWYGPGVDGSNQYVEITLPTHDIQTYPGLPKEPLDKQTGITEQFVLTPTGQAFINYDHFGPAKRVTYWLDRTAKSWMPIAVPAFGGDKLPHLKGNDGERLAFMGGNSITFLTLH